MVASLAIMGIAACGTTTNPAVLRIYDGPERADAELASLSLSHPNVKSVGITGKEVGPAQYGSVRLLPGTHTVTVNCLWGASVMVAPSGLLEDSAALEVLFQAGHSYSPRCDRSYGYTAQPYIWISDDTVDMAAAGRRKP
jgi:hypothetical protein